MFLLQKKLCKQLLWFIFWAWMPAHLFFRLIRVFKLEKQRVSTVTLWIFLINRITFLLWFYHYCRRWPLRQLREGRQGEVSEARPGNGADAWAHGLLGFNGIKNVATQLKKINHPMHLWKILSLISLVQFKLISKTDRTSFPKWGQLPVPVEWVLQFQMLTARPSPRNEGLPLFSSSRRRKAL